MNKLERITDIALPVIGGSIVGLLSTKMQKRIIRTLNSLRFHRRKKRLVLYGRFFIQRWVLPVRLLSHHEKILRKMPICITRSSG